MDYRAMYHAERAKRPDLQIARAVGCPAKPLTVPPVRAKRTNPFREHWATWATMYLEEGKTYIEIAEAFGTRWQTVQYACRKLGVTSRARGGAYRLSRANREIAQLKRDVALLKLRLAGMRRRLAALGEPMDLQEAA